MEQILVRNLPAGTKAALRARADRRGHSVEAEMRELIRDALRRGPGSIVDQLSMDEGAEIEFEPQRFRLRGRDAEL